MPGQKLFEYGNILATRQDVLPPEENERLALAYQAGDEKAGEKLIAANVRLVMKVVLKFYGDRDELFSEGMFGLMEAARRFDPTKGSEFAGYAWLWIRSKCLSYISQRAHMMRLSSRGARQWLWKAARVRGQLISEGIEPTAQALADQLSLPLKVIEELHMVLTPPISLSPGPDRDDYKPIALVDDRVPNPEEKCIAYDEHKARRKLMDTFSVKLDERDNAIFQDRMLGDAKLKDLGERFGVTKERIRQLEMKIWVRLREHLGAPPI